MQADLSPSSESLTLLDFPRIKILTVGNTKVGKSCLIKRYCENRFVNKYIPTIGIDYGVKKFEVNQIKYQEVKRKMQLEKKETINNNESNNNNNIDSNNDNNYCSTDNNKPPPAAIRVNFWDVAGGDEYAEVRNEFYESAQGIILVYDVRNQNSFNDLDKWWKEMSTYIPLPTIKESTLNTTTTHNTTTNDYSKNMTESKLRKASLTLTTNTTPAGKAVGNNSGRVPLLVLCANKVDDVVTANDSSSSSSNNNGNSAKRVVSEDVGREWANKHQCTAYVETSASSGANITDIL